MFIARRTRASVKSPSLPPDSYLSFGRPFRYSRHTSFCGLDRTFKPGSRAMTPASSGGTASTTCTCPARSAARRAAASGMTWKRNRRTSGAPPQYFSLRSNVRWSLRFHSTTFHGPVPFGLSLSASTPCASVYAFGTSGSRPMKSQSVGAGSLVWIRTVWVSTFSQRVT